MNFGSPQMPRALLQSHSGFMNCEHISDHVASSNLLSRIVFQGKLHPISKIILNQVALATMGTALFVGPNALQGAFCSFGVLARKSTWVVIFIEGRLRLEELPLNVISFDFISFIFIYIHISIYISFISFHLISFHLPKPIFHFAWMIIMKCLHNKKTYMGCPY